ncbi:hypothetical protein EDC01DRAFT_636992 [Geopyxis carbonaria]|nr:hypothetical protein EDC01DRAFT_636992 [Geopyxis carbonaria]
MTRPQASPETEALIKQVIDSWGPEGGKLPRHGQQCSDYEEAVENISRYAFTQGFATVVTKSDKKHHSRVISCYRYGKTANHRKLTAQAVPKDEYTAQSGVSEAGEKLRQRQGRTRACGCKWAITLTQRCYPSGPQKGQRMDTWTVGHRSVFEHNGHQLEADPFQILEHRQWHPGNHLAVANARKHRLIKIPYREHLRLQEPGMRRLSEAEYYNLEYDRRKTKRSSAEANHIIGEIQTAAPERLEAAEEHFQPRRKRSRVFAEAQQTVTVDLTQESDDGEQRAASEWITSSNIGRVSSLDYNKTTVTEKSEIEISQLVEQSLPYPQNIC